MPRTSKYPLTVLREHRDRAAQAATADLAHAVRAREAAEDAKRRADRAKNDAELRAAEVRREEMGRLMQGTLRVEDLSHAEAWEHAIRGEIAALVQAVADADRELSSAHAAEQLARNELAQRQAELEAVQKDEARFEERARRLGEARAEDEAEEVFQARSFENGRRA